MNLEELRVNPNPEPPKEIKKIAHSFLKEGETFNIFPQKIVWRDEKYYYVTFYPKVNQLTGILIINENGSIPSHRDAIEVRDCLSHVEARLENIFTHGLEWSDRPMKIWENLQSLLKSFAPVVNSSDNRDFQKGYEIFCSIPQVMFKTQDQLKKVVERAKEHYHQITIDYEITKDIYDKINTNYEHMLEIMKQQFKVQIETEKERTQFMKQLKETIPFIDLRKKLLYMRLKKLHKWLNADHETMAEYEDFKAGYSRKKRNEQERKELIEMLRNPRD